MSLSESDEDSARHGDDPEHDEFIQKLQQHHDERGFVMSLKRLLLKVITHTFVELFLSLRRRLGAR